MEIPKMDLWKITRVSFFDSVKGARLTLESIDTVVTAIENLGLPLQKESEEPQYSVEWKKWDKLYTDLYDALGDIRDMLQACEKYCRQNNEMWANYENLQDRYKRMRDHYGERS